MGHSNGDGYRICPCGPFVIGQEGSCIIKDIFSAHIMSIIKAIRKNIKIYFDRISNERLKTNLLQALPFWIAAILAGLVAVFYAKLFSLAENVTLFIIRDHKLLLFLVTPLCFLIAWWLVKRFAPFAAGSGIPQVMAAIELATPKRHDKVDKLLSIKIVCVKILSSLLMVLGGGIVGREGPTIQISASIFRTVNRWLPAWWPKISKRNMIMTGAAAGLAAAFNTPLGGIVFAVEELTKTHISYFKTALFSAIIIAGLTAQALLGPYLYLGYPDVNSQSYSILFGVIVVAVIAGLAGSIMSKVILAILKWKATFTRNRQIIFYILFCGLLVAAAGYFIDEKAVGSGKDIMTDALFTNNKNVPWYLPLLRMGGLIFSFSSGASGGVFAPSLSAGASIGALLSGWQHLSAQDTNILILSGMVGFLTGVTRTPFTSAILVLEMTNRHNVIFHLMLAGMFASLVSMIIDRHSFYDHLKVSYLKKVQHEEDTVVPVPAGSEEKKE